MIILVDPVYNPNFTQVTSSTKVGPGITVAKFLGSPGTRTQFDRVTKDKALIGRQLYLQAEAMRTAIDHVEFRNHRLIISEGIYVPAVTETPVGINDYKQTGRSVVYQLLNKSGEVDLSKTYDLAVYWKDFINFDKITLDYDTYDTSGKLVSQIVVTMPECPESFDITYTKDLETIYNGKLQSKNELIEILS
jgi:hypothetical protein